MRIAINTPVQNIQTSEISFPITAVVSKLEAEPEPLLWKMSADEVSPKSSLVERVISVVFALMACGILIDGALERFHLISIAALFQRG